MIRNIIHSFPSAILSMPSEMMLPELQTAYGTGICNQGNK